MGLPVSHMLNLRLGDEFNFIQLFLVDEILKDAKVCQVQIFVGPGRDAL